MKNGRSSSALNKRIHRAIKNKKLVKIKRGFYLSTEAYLQEQDKIKSQELIASQLYTPSYLSLGYMLQKYQLLFGDGQITSVTTKISRHFANFVGDFKYFNIKKSLYFGFEEIDFQGRKYYVATKSKALFDYFYLKSNLNYRNSKKLKRLILEESGIQWNNFSENDFKLFDKYVWQSNSKKMMRIWEIINNYFESKKFDGWAKELLSL